MMPLGKCGPTGGHIKRLPNHRTTGVPRHDLQLIGLSGFRIKEEIGDTSGQLILPDMGWSFGSYHRGRTQLSGQFIG